MPNAHASLAPSLNLAQLEAKHSLPLTLSSQSPTALSPSSQGIPAAQLVCKTWDIPPRPKPGRKPANDAPPTKRKAQNRAAQRAFRERRAARVSELEEEQRKRQAEFREQMTRLQEENTDLRSEVNALRKQISSQLHIIDRQNRSMERQSANHSHRRWQQSATEPDDGINMKRKRSDDNPYEPRAPPPISTSCVPPTPGQIEVSERQPAGCGHCGKDGRCECIESILNAPDISPSGEDARVKEEPNEDMEIDLTHFGKNNRNDPILVHENQLPMRTPLDDTCGFCTDDTNCVCRAEANSISQHDPTTASQSVITPPDSTGGDEVRRFSLDKPQPMEPRSSARGPGTCPSCISDPARREFCQTLAKVNPPRPRPQTGVGSSFSSQLDLLTDSERLNSRVTCSDAYTMLSKDPTFEHNRSNPAFLERLLVQPPREGRKCDTCDSTNCSPFEVDCISILAAMREKPD